MRPTVTELRWRDPPLAAIDTPKGRLRLTLSVGSGLSRRAGDTAGRVWGLGDRGPNMKVKVARQRYGLEHLKPLKDLAGAKILPLPDFQPLLAELQVGPERVELVRTLPLRTLAAPFSGRPLPGGDSAEMEPTFDLDGQPLATDVAGCDPEGVAALADGGFWVAEEYGPSLLRVGPDGVVTARWNPQGLALPGAEQRLPAAALRRRLNRGFEGVCVSGDELWLYAVFQSALEGDGLLATTIWKLDARDGTLAASYAYPFDPTASFRRDAAAGEAKADDLKVCELVWLGPDRLLVLERMSRDARLYTVELNGPAPLAKTQVFSTDDHPEVAPDLEGAALLSDRELLLATDNDFGTEGAETRFYRLTWDAPL
ncbi:esterase-like activity of phytase family protein [uncultured Phenylobacterium sp.]|uniref:esterase-like activity of phytase family protein n=1 Tax=uncultured Phenylobacterium sp. TaxID=349273 RepID=UPI0026000939|nr:esterase-like activity of phytase family protein [uncultured Phenylobacterium sp.]